MDDAESENETKNSVASKCGIVAANTHHILAFLSVQDATFA